MAKIKRQEFNQPNEMWQKLIEMKMNQKKKGLEIEIGIVSSAAHQLNFVLVISIATKWPEQIRKVDEK